MNNKNSWPFHQRTGAETKFPIFCEKMNREYFDDWQSLSSMIMDHFVFLAGLMKKPYEIMFTENIVEDLKGTSDHMKINYQKESYIKNYQEMKNLFDISKNKVIIEERLNSTLNLFSKEKT